MQGRRRAVRLLTLTEAAEMLRISRTTAWRLVRRRELPAVRVGKQLRVAEEDLLAFLRSHREGMGQGGEGADMVERV
jgi:excisionase family DNA binding protein